MNVPRSRRFSAPFEVAAAVVIGLVALALPLAGLILAGLAFLSALRAATPNDR